MSRNTNMHLERVSIRGVPGFIFLCKDEKNTIKRIVPLICSFFESYSDRELILYLEPILSQRLDSFLSYSLNSICDLMSLKNIDTSSFSPFRRKIYAKLLDTKKGKTITYSELANTCDYKNQARSVGRAMKENPHPLVIPCHRVISKSGKEMYNITCLNHKPSLCMVEDVSNCSKKIKEMIRDLEVV